MRIQIENEIKNRALTLDFKGKKYQIDADTRLNLLKAHNQHAEEGQKADQRHVQKMTEILKPAPCIIS